MIPNGFEQIVGDWTGSNRLHTVWIPENPISDSVSNCSVRKVANGQSIELDYSWEYGGEKQTGLMIIRSPKDKESVDIYWLDSWHLSNLYLLSEGAIKDGVISVMGHYKVEGHPDWGWRTDFEVSGADSFSFTMYNVTPEGEESLAVESKFTRV